MKNDIRLGIVCPKITDATSLYRCGGIIKELSKEIEIKETFFKEVSYIDIKSQDVFFLQRPCTPEHVSVALACKQMGVKVWIDYDDNLFEVPPDNPSYPKFMNEEVHTNIKMLLNKADAVTVTTQSLQDALSEFCDADKIHVVPNAYDERFHGKIMPQSRNFAMAWRGSITHRHDLNEYKEPLIEFINSDLFREWGVHFFGCEHYEIKSKIKNPYQHHYHGPCDPLEYIINYRAIHPAIHIVPLARTSFNASKSNIAMIEAATVGACVIAPDWEEWQEADYKYSNEFDFYDCLVKAITDFNERKKPRKKSLFTLKETSVMRAKVIRQILRNQK